MWGMRAFRRSFDFDFDGDVKRGQVLAAYGYLMF